jgi:PQQ-dependent catabolism-associated CXXCW motif protein
MTIRTKTLAAGLISTLCLALPAEAQKVAVVNYVCNLEGAQAQLTARVQAVTSAGVFLDPSGLFAGSISTGDVNLFYEGAVTSATSRYSFTGTNQFADFVDLNANERFRVQFIAQGTQLLMIVNPHGPGPVRYMCQQRGGPAGHVAGNAQSGGQVPQRPTGRVVTSDQSTQVERKDYGVQATRRLHNGQMHGPTPATIPGGQVITTQGLVALAQSNQVPFIVFDTLGGAEALPGAIPAVWASQSGSFNDQVQRQLEQTLQQRTGGRKEIPLIFYCHSDQCWMSYNAALRAIHAGYTNVLWYRGGLAAWKAAGLPTQHGTAVALRPSTSMGR